MFKGEKASKTNDYEWLQKCSESVGRMLAHRLRERVQGTQ